MNAKQRKVYEQIFKNPMQLNIDWQEIENLLKSLGAKISEGNGSRVRIELNGERAVFHRPHPERETDKGAVKSTTSPQSDEVCCSQKELHSGLIPFVSTQSVGVSNPRHE